MLAHTTTFLLCTSRPAHRSYTKFISHLQGKNGRVTGCPSWVKCSLTCFGSVRSQDTTEKAHSKWENHFQNEQRMGKMRALCRLFVAYVGIHSFSHHTLS